MRVTFGSGYDIAMADLEHAVSELTQRQREVSSGKRVNTPSDDPASAAAAIRERAELQAIDQYSRAADSVGSRVTVIDTILSDMIDKIIAAQASASGARGTTQTDAQREATASELEGLRDAVLTDINSTFGGRYLFGGSSSLTPPYSKDAAGTVSGYLGDANALSVDIDRDRSVQVTYDARVLTQGGEAQDVFQVFSALITAVRGNDQQGIIDGLAALGKSLDRVTGVQSGVGADMNAIESHQARLTQLQLAGEARLSKDEDANMAESITKMNQASTVYEAALSAVAKRSKLSLLDYLG